MLQMDSVHKYAIIIIYIEPIYQLCQSMVKKNVEHENIHCDIKLYDVLFIMD